jgi:histidinol dehydrogenase
MKRSSVGYVTAPAFAGLARRAKLLSEYEGFASHAVAVSAERETLLSG